jgi:hypothetical protein
MPKQSGKKRRRSVCVGDGIIEFSSGDLELILARGRDDNHRHQQQGDNHSLDEATQRALFDAKIAEYQNSLGQFTIIPTRAKLNAIKRVLLNGGHVIHDPDFISVYKEALQKKWRRKFRGVRCGDELFIVDVDDVKKITDADGSINPFNIKRVACQEELYEILRDAYTSDHAGSRRFHRHLAERFANITRPVCEAFVSICASHSRKRLRSINSTKTCEFNSSGVASVISMRASPDRKIKFILRYEDEATHFGHMLPLRAKNARLIASQLHQIFASQGAPNKLLYLGGNAYAEKIMSHLRVLWPTIHTLCDDIDTCDTVQRIRNQNKRIRTSVLQWAKTHPALRWSTVGIHSVQMQLNITKKQDAVAPYVVLYQRHFKPCDGQMATDDTAASTTTSSTIKPRVDRIESFEPIESMQSIESVESLDPSSEALITSPACVALAGAVAAVGSVDVGSIGVELDAMDSMNLVNIQEEAQPKQPNTHDSLALPSFPLPQPDGDIAIDVPVMSANV